MSGKRVYRTEALLAGQKALVDRADRASASTCARLPVSWLSGETIDAFHAALR